MVKDLAAAAKAMKMPIDALESRLHPRVGFIIYTLNGPPHAVIVTIRDNRDCIRVLLYSYYTTITGWGVLLIQINIYICIYNCRIIYIYMSQSPNSLKGCI